VGGIDPEIEAIAAIEETEAIGEIGGIEEGGEETEGREDREGREAGGEVGGETEETVKAVETEMATVSPRRRRCMWTRKQAKLQVTSRSASKRSLWRRKVHIHLCRTLYTAGSRKSG
jgi:hypothetical protein